MKQTRNRTTLAAAAALAAMVPAAAPVSAQYMPHLDPNLYMLTVMNMTAGPNTCMTGLPLPDKEIAEARDPAPGVMQRYFEAAQNGTSRLGAFRQSGKTSWTHAGKTVLLPAIDTTSDPLAVAGNRLEAEPLRFVRSGNFESAQGQWAVMDAGGAVAGVYDAQFRRQSGVWLLQSLTVLGADETVAPAMQYCLKPGDVTEHKVTSAQNLIDYHTKQIAKSEAKLVKEQAALAKAEAALAAKPGGASQAEAVRRAKAVVERREEKLADSRKGLADAEEFKANSLRDQVEIAAMTGPARDALRIRGFETTSDREAAEKRAKEKAEREAEKAEKAAK